VEGELQSGCSVLIVEDNDDLRTVTEIYLKEKGFAVESVESAEALADSSSVPDIYIIDINLPGDDGLALAQRVRQSHPGVGIIVITARRVSTDLFESYSIGADIFLSKPFEPGELFAALGTLSRRVKFSTSATASLTVDMHSLKLKGPSRAIPLTAGEAAFLRNMARSKDRQLEYWEAAEVLGMNLDTTPKSALEVRVVRLRKKIDASGYQGATIVAVRGQGYRLQCDLTFA